ncbi:MAG: hypothetical protein NTY99_03775 [DPANN group archaeon]|nr:hypothetical protein [DPANN group archaeon]
MARTKQVVNYYNYMTVKEGIIIGASSVPMGMTFRGQKDYTMWLPQFSIFQPSKSRPLEVTQGARPVGDRRLWGPIEADANKRGKYKCATLFVYPADEAFQHKSYTNLAKFVSAFTPDEKDPNQDTLDVYLDMLNLDIKNGGAYAQDAIFAHTKPNQFITMLLCFMSNPLYLTVGYETHHSGEIGLPAKYHGQINLPLDKLKEALIELRPKLEAHFGIEDRIRTRF